MKSFLFIPDRKEQCHTESTVQPELTKRSKTCKNISSLNYLLPGQRTSVFLMLWSKVVAYVRFSEARQGHGPKAIIHLA